MIKPIKLPKSLQSTYEKGLEAEKIQIAQILCILGIVIFAGSTVMDKWAISSALNEVLFLRGLVILTFLFTFLSTFYSAFFLKHYQIINTIAFLAPAFAVDYSIYLSESSDIAFYSYYGALVVIFMILYSWGHLKIINLIMATVLILGGYIIAIMLHDDYGSHEVFALLVPSLSILSGSILIGFTGKLIRDNYLCQNFLLQQSLKASFEQKEKEAETHEYHSHHDTLTNLPNRRYAKKYLDNQLNQVKQLDKLMIVMFLDLNNFKEINDVFGHDAGDRILKVTADRLKLCTGRKDCLIRFGGDEFLVCISIEKHMECVINNMINNIKAIISKPIIFKTNKLKITTSIGVAISSKDSDQIDTLITIADKRMYQDKSTINETNKMIFETPDNNIRAFSKKA